MLTAPTNNQPVWSGHHSIKNDIWRCGHAPFSLRHACKSFNDREQRQCRITDLVGFKNDLPAPTIKSNEPATSTFPGSWCGKSATTQSRSSLSLLRGPMTHSQHDSNEQSVQRGAPCSARLHQSPAVGHFNQGDRHPSSPQRLHLERVIREKMERKEAENVERKQSRRKKTEKGQTRTEKRDHPPPQALPASGPNDNGFPSRGKHGSQHALKFKFTRIAN